MLKVRESHAQFFILSGRRYSSILRRFIRVDRRVNCMLFTVESATTKVKLFTKEEAAAVVEKLKAVPEYNVKLLDVTHGVSSGEALTPEGQAFADSKPRISQFPEGKRPPEYTELGNFPHPFMPRISAREIAKLIAFLKGNGGYSLITTQELGNCMWASVLRGTDVKKEFASMYLRRLVVMMIGAYPKFFFNYLKYSLASTYGQDRSHRRRNHQEGKGGHHHQ